MVDEKEEIASIEFWTYIRIKVINEKNAHLLKEILEDSKSLSLEHNVELFIKETKYLGIYLEKNFNDQIGFFNSGKQVIVYSPDTSPCQHLA